MRENATAHLTVFEVILESSAQICDASFDNIYSHDGNGFRLAAAHKKPPAFVDYRRRSPITIGAYATGRMATTKTVIHVADLLRSALISNLIRQPLLRSHFSWSSPQHRIPSIARLVERGVEAKSKAYRAPHPLQFLRASA
jgi:hypothetical protein